MQAEHQFFTFHLSNLIEMGVVILAYLAYRRESKKDAKDRDAVKVSQAVLHRENQMKLDALIEFNKAQVDANRQRDTQITLLATQTTQLTTLAQGFERRLVMLENRS